jgi:integrase
MEEARLRLGREPSLREGRRIRTELGIFGPKGVSNVITTFNLAASLSEEIDNVVVAIRLRKPKATASETTRGIASANPNKILSPQQIAELERVLGRDLRRYETARGRLLKELGPLDARDGIVGKPSPLLDLQRYFGIDGFREHSAHEISQLKGLSSSTNIHIRVQRFLSKRVGSEKAAEIVGLRSKFANLRRQRKFAEVEASKRYILGILSTTDLKIGDSTVLFYEKYFGLNGSRIHSLPAIATQFGTPTETVRHHVLRHLVSLVGKTKASRLIAIRRRLRCYLSRAIKAQAVRLQLCVARRISAVLEVPAETKTKVHVTEGRRIVEIQFHSRKTWGDEGLSEWVPCVDTFGKIAEDAIRVTQRLTKALREVAPEDTRQLLFIIPNRSFDSAVSLSHSVLHAYIYTSEKRKDRGLVRRYALEGLSSFSFHDIRHTHSTHMIEAGGTLQDVAQYLGHTNVTGSATMAGTFYLAGGTEAMRERTANALRSGAATGHIFDGIARLKIEAMGGEAKKTPVPPNQLSFEQARHRILSADIIEEIPLEPAEAAKLLNQKVVFNVTRTGGCLLQATSGHCPTSNPCAIGILPKGAEPTLGCGCKYLVILPHSAENLTTDIAIMEAQLAEMAGEEWVGWRSHIQAKREHYRSLLGVAMSLNESGEKDNQESTTNC